MARDEFVRRSAGAASNAMNYSFGEMMHQRSSQPLPARLGKVLFGKSLRPFIPESMTVHGQTFSLLASGGEQLVYSNGDEIVKVIHKSLTFDRATAGAQTQSYGEQYELASRSLGEHSVATDFDVKRLRAGLFATIAMQPHLRPDKQFEDVDDLISYRSDETYMERLRRFSDSLRTLYSSAGMQVDLNGPNNVLLIDERDDPGLRIVDTLPVTPEIQSRVHPQTKKTVGELIMAKMAMIEQAVSLPIELVESREVVLH
jgi:hypothetical protein